MYQYPLDYPAHRALGNYRGFIHRLHDRDGETPSVTDVFLNRRTQQFLFTGALIDWERTIQSVAGTIFPALRRGVVYIPKATSNSVMGLVFGIGHQLQEAKQRLYWWQVHMRVVVGRNASVDVGIGHPGPDAIVANSSLRGLPPLKPWDQSLNTSDHGTADIGKQSGAHRTYLVPSTFLPVRHDHFLPPNRSNIALREHVVTGQGMVHISEPDFDSTETGTALWMSISNHDPGTSTTIHEIIGSMTYFAIGAPDPSIITEVL